MVSYPTPTQALVRACRYLLRRVAGEGWSLMSAILNRILHDLREKQAREDSRLLPTPSVVREQSTTEKNATYQPPNYGILFCCHGKSYFDVCSNCKRTRRIARLHYENFCLKHGLEY